MLGVRLFAESRTAICSGILRAEGRVAPGELKPGAQAEGWAGRGTRKTGGAGVQLCNS